MSIHRNVLKLHGCCVEGDVALVFEYGGNKILSDCLFEDEVTGERGVGDFDYNSSVSLSWKCRLRMANQIATVLAYLHTALHRPVVHRDAKTGSFVIDENGVLKLYDFSSSISIPLGESGIEAVVTGTLGFLDPEYSKSYFVTDKCDVYSFGVFQLTLLTGQQPITREDDGELVHIRQKVKSYIENDRLNDIVDPRIFGEGGRTDQQRQFQAFIGLAFRCTQVKGDDRPEMIEVAKELRRIERESLHP